MNLHSLEVWVDNIEYTYLLLINLIISQHA